MRLGYGLLAGMYKPLPGSFFEWQRRLAKAGLAGPESLFADASWPIVADGHMNTTRSPD